MWDGEDEVETDFPLHDGTADTAHEVVCPCCGAASWISLDPGSGPLQDYVEDCEVCCRPWNVTVRYADDGSARVWLAAADE